MPVYNINTNEQLFSNQKTCTNFNMFTGKVRLQCDWEGGGMMRQSTSTHGLLAATPWHTASQ